MQELLESCKFNWFVFSQSLKDELRGYSEVDFDNVISDFALQLPSLGLTKTDEQKVEKSREAYLQIRKHEEIENEAENMIVSDSDNEDSPEEWLQVNDPLGSKERASFRRKFNLLEEKQGKK